MSRRWRLIPLVLCVGTAGCITGFTHPLGPAGQAHIDARLLGTWKCVSTSDEGRADPGSSGDLIFRKFDSSQYYAHMADGESQPADIRALATLLGDSSFLSLRVIGPKPDDEWTILQYTFPDASHLTLMYVEPEPFKDVLDEPQAVRDRLEARLGDPDVVSDFLQCTRDNRTDDNERKEERSTTPAPDGR